MNPALLGAARAGSTDLAGLRELLRHAVVAVQSGHAGSGAGIIWGGAGLVVTNAHCAPRGDALRVDAHGKWREARLLAYHPRHDLALLTAPSVSGPLLEVREPESLRIGELVLAHGHPLGVRDALAMGVVHALARDDRTRAPRWVVSAIRLAPGNSGGPLVDAAGRLVGLNSMVVNGLGIAVAATLVQRFVEGALSRRVA
ncbi:MAG TPA: serine protease [Gemmatimonadales bacterium]|jgi:serine protease Do|nr:serine protease [Gemmatimonadales bacterium]